ncbi:MAG: hypothetical protein JJT81_14620 [Rubellimicrobium sp.]|nr:hypothetical protein [Rubellimicrobium sp.]
MFAGFGTAAWIGATGRFEDWIIVGGAVALAFATGWFVGPRPRKNRKDGQGS